MRNIWFCAKKNDNITPLDDIVFNVSTPELNSVSRVRNFFVVDPLIINL
jgi:hypothetical protein